MEFKYFCFWNLFEKTTLKPALLVWLNSSLNFYVWRGICASWTECIVLHLSGFGAKRWNLTNSRSQNLSLRPETEKRIGNGKNGCCNRPASGLFSSAIDLFLSVIGLQQAVCRQKKAGCRPITGSIEPVAGRLQANYRRKQAGCRTITDENKPIADENRLDRACNRLNVDTIKMVGECFKMVFTRKRMVESLFSRVLRCFENILRRNVPTSGSTKPDVGTFLHNKWIHYFTGINSNFLELRL